MFFDPATESGTRAERRLRDEQVVWLTTVASNGQPQPSPVWFLWDGSTILVYSQPDKPKLRNLSDNARVALNFNSTPDGGDVIIISGHAEITSDVPPAHEHPAYLEKYRQGIADIGMTPESFADEYSVAIQITPVKLRAY